MRLLVDDFDPAQVSPEREDHRRAHERGRVEMMRADVEAHACRRAYLLNYLSEEYMAAPRGMCDTDARQPPHRWS